jgi:phage-related protein/cell wall-associated NlpC family hydrolase
MGAGIDLGVGYIPILPDMTGFEEKVAAGTEKASGSARIKTAGKALGASFIAAAAGVTAVGISRLLESEKVDKQIAAREKSTRESAGVTGEHIDKLSNKLLNLSGVDNEATKSAAALLLTFRDIKNEGTHKAFDETTKAILNVATAMNNGAIPSAEQLKTTVIQVGKAVNDPIKGMSALRRVGVSFTESQETQVKTLVESGKQYAAQKIILGELNKEFAGSAKAAGSTLQGQLDKTKAKFQNLAAELVKGLMPVFNKVLEVAGNVVDFFEQHKEFAKVFLAGLAVVGTTLLIAFGGPITAAIAALAALAIGISEAWKHSETFRDVVTKVMEDAKAAFKAALPWVENALGNVVTALKDAEKWAKNAFNNIVAEVNRVVNAFKTFWKESGVVREAVKLIADAAKMYLGIMEKVFMDVFSKVVTTAKRAWAGILEALKGAFQIIKGVVEVFSGILTGHFGRAWNGVKNIFSGALKFIVGLFKDFTAPIRGQAELIGDALSTVFTTVWGVIEGIFEDGVNAVAGFLQDLANIINPLLSAIGVGEIHITGEVAGKNTGSTAGKHGAKGQAYASGGPVTVPGSGNRDTVPLAVNGAVSAVVAPGEQLMVVNQHQAPLLNAAVGSLGYGSLAGFFAGNSKPHYQAASGGLFGLPHFDEGFLGTGIGPSVHEITDTGKTLFDTAKTAAGFIGGLPGLPSSLHGIFGEIGGAVLGKIADWVKSLPGSIFGGGSSGALSGGSTASALEFAQFMLQAGFPANATVIAEGLGTIKSESDFQKNTGQLGEPEAHIGPWAESPAFGSVKTRLDPLGSTEAAYKEWVADNGFYQAWGQYEASQSGLPGGGAGAYGSEYLSVANQAIREASGRTGSIAKKASNHHHPILDNGETHALLLKAHGLKKLTEGGTAKRAVAWAENNLGRGPHWGDPPGGWCGAFLGADMKAMGIEPPSDYPFSEAWAKWGESVSHSNMLPGDILDYNDTHVAMYIGHGEQIQGNDGENKVGKSGIGSSLGLGPLSAISRPPYKTEAEKEKHLNKAQETVHTFKESVPAEYANLPTKGKFGPVPKSLENIEKALHTTKAEVVRYTAAIKHANHNKRPAIAQALEGVRNEARSFINELTRARTKSKTEVAQRKFSRKVTGRLNKLDEFNEKIAEKERGYTVAEQVAQQVIGAEPSETRIPRNATEEQQEAIETAYDEKYNSYVEGKERPAYEAVLGKEASWRNEILRGENFATQLEGNWETKIIGLDHTIDKIENMAKPQRPQTPAGKGPHPKFAKALEEYEKAKRHYDKQQAKLPMLKFEDRETKKGLTEARGDFFGGHARVTDPSPPTPGSGTLEEGLQGLQGVYWPGLHEHIDQLPGFPTPGQFGGTIYDTQETIAGLELRIFEAGEPKPVEESEAESKLKEIAEKMLEEERHKNAVLSSEIPVFNEFINAVHPKVPFGGVFHSGGVVGGPYGQETMILAQGGETVIPLDAEGATFNVHTHVHDGAVNSDHIETVVEKVNGGNVSKARRKNNVRAGR